MKKIALLGVLFFSLSALAEPATLEGRGNGKESTQRDACSLATHNAVSDARNSCQRNGLARVFGVRAGRCACASQAVQGGFLWDCKVSAWATCSE